MNAQAPKALSKRAIHKISMAEARKSAEIAAKKNAWIQATLNKLKAAAHSAGFVISGDERVTGEDAETLLGLPVGFLLRKHAEGDGPRCYRIGGGINGYTYRLCDLACYVESCRIDPLSASEHAA